MALEMMARQPEPKRSIYETRGLLRADDCDHAGE
jgi:hypothetical protein